MRLRVEFTTEPFDLDEAPAHAVVARQVIERVCADAGTTYEDVDISGSAELMRAYGEQIPVTFVDGRQHDFWRVDDARLRRALGPG